MDPPAAAPPLPPLPAGRAAFLHSCVAGMTADTWLQASQVQATLSRAEGLLCALRGVGSLQQYLQAVTGAGGGGAGPCTSVWTAGTIAYR